MILIVIPSSFTPAFASSVTYTKGSDGSAAHQYKNPCKVTVQADPGLVVWKTLYLEPRSYSFPVTARAAPGWKIVSARYRNNSDQDVVSQPPSAAAASTWPFTVPKNCTLGGNARIVTVHFATLRQTPGGSPDYQEDITIATTVVSSLATLDVDANGLRDQWEIQFFGHTGNDPAADPDGDGLTNLQESQAGTNPNDFWNGAAPVISIVSGNNQGDLAGNTLAQPLVVRVSNAQGVSAKTGAVTFAITSSTGGSLSPSGAVNVNMQGTAQASLSLPSDNAATGSTVAVKATTNNDFGNREVTFTANVVAMPPTLGPLTVTGTGLGIGLSWKKPGVTVTYVIQRFDKATGTWVTIGTSSTTDFTDQSGPGSNALEKGVIYLYKVTASGAGANAETSVQGAVINPEENDDTDALNNGEEVEAGYYSQELADGTMAAGTIKLGNNPSGWVGPDPKLADTDLDGVNDAIDGWANTPDFHPPRLPETNYALIELEKLGVPERRIYDDGQGDSYSTTSVPCQINDSFQIIVAEMWNAYHFSNFSFFDAKTQELTPFPDGFSPAILENYFDRYSAEAPRVLNNSGRVCGSCRVGENTRAAVWTKNGGISMLEDYHAPYLAGTYDQKSSGIAYAMSENNTLAGEEWQYGSKDYPLPDGNKDTRTREEFGAMRWSPGAAVLGDHITEEWYGGSAQGGDEFQAFSVNDDGLAVGHFYHWAVYPNSSGNGSSSGIDVYGAGIYDNGLQKFGLGLNGDELYCIDNSESPHAFGSHSKGEGGPREPYLWQKTNGTWTGHDLTAGIYGEIARVNNRFEMLGLSYPFLRNGKQLFQDRKFGGNWEALNIFDINNLGVAIGTAYKVKDDNGNSTPANQQYPHPIALVPCDIVPDLNRDGKIDNLDQGKITKDRPWRWWINDDADSGDTGDGYSDVPMWAEPPLTNFSTEYVDGRCDLLDWAPLWLDIKQLVDVLPPGTFTYKFKQEDEAVGVVFTDLVKADAGKYLKQDYTTSFGSALTSPPQSADAVQVTSAGVEIPPAFLNKIKADGNKGVILVEGAAKTTKPLVLEIYKGSDKVADFSFNISIDDVERMYRWINLRGVAGQSEGIHTNTAEPTNYPDKETNGKMFIMVHGYNVNELQSRGWAAEAFKRLYQSGSKAMFTGVSWHGDSSQIPGLGVSPDYYENVTHAFQTAPALASAVNDLKGGSNKIIAGHSLGNMVVSAAIKDNSMNVAKYFMLDAAVAIEAFDQSDLKMGSMSPQVWRNYDTRLWSSKWHELFSDGRSKLTWQNRFGSVGAAWNFYSSTEDVLNNSNGSIPSVIPPSAERAWASQEMRKGSTTVGWITLDSHGGWGFNGNWDTGDTTSSYYPHRSPSAAAQLTDDEIKTDPFFKRFQSQYNFLYQSSSVAADFYKDTSNAGGAKLLAEAIPAVSFATGRNSVNTFGGTRNIDLMSQRDGEWPYGGTDDRWHHSDAKDVAYRYNYPLWQSWINLGELK